MDEPRATSNLSKASLDDLKDEIREQRWCAAHEAYSNGYEEPEILYPVIIGEGTPILSPSELKEYADLESTPEHHSAEDIPASSTEPTKVVVICRVNQEQLLRIRQKSTFEHHVVLFQDEMISAILITSKSESQAKGKMVSEKKTRSRIFAGIVSLYHSFRK